MARIKVAIEITVEVDPKVYEETYRVECTRETIRNHVVSLVDEDQMDTGAWRVVRAR